MQVSDVRLGGNRISALVEGAFGMVGIESDLSASSSSTNVQGSSWVELGAVDAPGYYPVRLTHGAGAAAVGILVLRGPGGKFLVGYSRGVAVPAGKVPAPGLLERFAGLITPQRLWEGLAKALPGWVAQQAPNAVIAGALCATGVGAMVCVSEYLGIGADLGLLVLVEVAGQLAREGQLAQADADDIALFLSVAKVAGAIILGLDAGKFDLSSMVLDTVDAAVEGRIQDADVKAMLSTLTGSLKKFVLIWEVRRTIP